MTGTEFVALGGMNYALWFITSSALFAAGLVVTWANRRRQRRLGGGGDKPQKMFAEKRLDKKRSLDDSLKALEEKLSGKLFEEEIECISKLGTQQLLHKLKSDELSPVKVLHAFQSKMLQVQKRANCLTELIVEADKWAESLQLSKEKGPLYGLPVCVKDDIGMKGYDCVIGCAEFINKPFAGTSPIVQVLLNLGAIPFARTNVPQTIISFHSSNPIFGLVRNPRDVSRTAGGSSGGSGAMVAAGGVPIALGSDLAGSIRCPAFLNGVCGFKQTGGRLSQRFTRDPVPGSKIILNVYGALAKDVDGILLAMRAWCSQELFKLDRTLPPLVFNEQLFAETQPLRIGYFTNNGLMRPLPPCERAVLLTKTVLENNGHQLVQFQPPHMPQLMACLSAACMGDGGKSLLKMTQNDKVDKLALESIMTLIRIPKFIHQHFQWLLNFLFDPRLVNIVSAGKRISSTYDYWQTTKNCDDLKASFFQYWDQAGLDALICPGFGVIPMPFETFSIGSFFSAGSYTSIWNVLSCPAGIVPVTCVSGIDHDNLAEYPTHNRSHKEAKEGMAGAGPLPVGVQVVTLPWKDETCLRLMKEIENTVQFKSPPCF